MRLLVSGKPETIIKTTGESYYHSFLGGFVAPTGYYDMTYCENHGLAWGIDNGAYTNFNQNRFVKILEKYKDSKTMCKFCVAPDVVGNFKETWEKFLEWQPIIRSYGYPLALALQDGVVASELEWDFFDAIFIGGTTEWKLSPYVASVVATAIEKGKWVHMGRVNGRKRIRYARSIGCNSVDGSSFSRFKSKLLTVKDVFYE